MKQHPTEWEKISANHLSDRGFNIQNINHEGNANQNHNDMLLNTHQGIYYQNLKITSVGKEMEKLEPL